MEKQNTKYIIAECAIWFVVLTVLFCILFFIYSKIFIEPNIYNIDFKDINGITKGSPVRFMGLNVGYVRNLKSKNEYIQVQIIITEKNMKLPNGTTAHIQFYGLGGSKSIELMPPQGTCDVGIVTNHTIRINEIANEAFSLFELIDDLDKYISGLNKSKMESILEAVIKTKDDKIKTTNKNIDSIHSNIMKKAENIKNKQREIIENIQSASNNVVKINKFIKKY